MATTSPRTVLITGCSDGGLGSHLCLAFHSAGWRVFATARNVSKLKTMETNGIETMPLDVTSEESVATCVAQLEKLTGGSLDMLLNNAGAGYSMPVLDIDLAKARDLFDLNVFSLITITRAFLPLLRKSTGSQGGTQGGIIVNNTSCSALPGGALPFAGAYNSSKAAATSITEALRLELEPFGIKVITMMTAGVKSNFYDNAQHPSLPPDSIYNVAKETVEKAMSGARIAAGGADPEKWAKNIVASLSKSKPPHWVWGGNWVTTVRLCNLLPIGTADGIVKPMVGLDVITAKVQACETAGKEKTG